MKKPLSTMTTQQLVEATRALGTTYGKLAQRLGKSPSAISRYLSGNPIPQDVAEPIRDMLSARVKELTAMGQNIHASNVVSSLIVYENEHRTREPHPTTGRFFRRQREPDTRTYPLYRMSLERFNLYVLALMQWSIRVRELAREHVDQARQRDYHLELADLKALAACAPRQAPYDVCIQRNEWDVVSRALRHLGTQSHPLYCSTHALRVHWAKHRGCGYPKHRVSATTQSHVRHEQS